MLKNPMLKSKTKKKTIKSAQVTIFIVVGLVLLGILGILTSLTDVLKTQSVTTEAPSQNQYRFDTAVTVIRNCIQTSALQSISLIASQGGALYESQNGWDSSSGSIPITRVGANTVFVAPGIVRRSDEPIGSTTLAQPPGEIQSTPIDPLTSQAVLKLGGSVVLHKLCDRYGPNNPTNPNISLTCELASYGYDGHSIQNELAKSIQKKTIDCVHQSEDVLSQVGDVQTYFGQKPQVILGDDTVTVSYIFNTSVSISQSNFSYMQSTTTLPLRLKQLYNFLYAVLDTDTKNILFDKSTSFTSVVGCNYPGTSLCWIPGFELDVVYRAYTSASGQTYDLVIARDRNSTVLGSPLEFWAIVENRRPVLAPFYDPTTFPSFTTYSQSDWTLRYTRYANYIDTILLKPIAYDFDEDNSITYNYSGWWGTNTVDFKTCDQVDQNGDCQLPVGCDSFNPLKCTYWSDTYYYNSRQLNAEDNAWQNSAPYQSGDQCFGMARQCASISLRSDGSDIGPHVVTVTATDRGGLSDTASVAILVGTD